MNFMDFPALFQQFSSNFPGISWAKPPISSNLMTEAWRKALVEGPPQRERVEYRSAPRVLALNEHVR